MSDSVAGFIYGLGAAFAAIVAAVLFEDGGDE